MSTVDMEFKKSVIEALAEKIGNNIKREMGLQRELADDHASMRMVEKMQDDLEPMPENCGYTDYKEWVTALEKEIASGVGSIAKIQEQKIELEALEYYLENIG